MLINTSSALKKYLLLVLLWKIEKKISLENFHSLFFVDNRKIVKFIKICILFAINPLTEILSQFCPFFLSLSIIFFLEDYMMSITGILPACRKEAVYHGIAYRPTLTMT